MEGRFNKVTFADLTDLDKEWSHWLGYHFFEPPWLPTSKKPNNKLPYTMLSKMWLLLATEHILEHLSPRGGDRYWSTIARMRALSEEVRHWRPDVGVGTTRRFVPRV